MNDDEGDVIFTPDNEPYLGRELLFHFDNVICSCLEQSGKVAPHTHEIAKTDLQQAACQLIPQAISIALSVRELIRQGYLFGALVLVRPLSERAAILMYLHEKPAEIAKWNRGWRHNEAPSLARMFESIATASGHPLPVKGHQLTALHNSVLHGKPDCAVWSMMPLQGGRFGHMPSKILDNPALCDEICAQVVPWLVCVQGMIGAYFPELSNT
jgi:hypothetical protein